MELKKRTLDYKWVILVVCFLMEFLCLGFCSSNPGLYTKAVTDALQIKRSLYSLSSSIRYVVQVVTALYFGTMIAKFGIKKMALAGFIGLVGSVAIRAYATELWHIYAGSVLWGAGIVFCGGTMASTIVRQWFHQDVGRYTGIVMSANGIGGAVAAQIISPLINSGETFGYRKAYILSALVGVAITVVVLIFLREQPAEGQAATGGKKKQPRGGLWAGIPHNELKKKPYFYVTAALVFLTGISIQSVSSVAITYSQDMGISAEFIALTATVSSLCLTFSKVLVGILYDKKGLGVTLLLCQVCALFGFVQKCFQANTTVGLVLYMVATILNSLAMPLETVMISLIAGDLFGAVDYNKNLGIVMAANSLGLCLGSPLGDWCREQFGSYKPCFWFFAIVMVAVMVGYRFVLRAADKEKQKLFENA